MANISTSGLDELIGSLEKIAEIPDDTILEMLTAEAEVVAAEQRAALSTAYHGSTQRGLPPGASNMGKSSRKQKTGGRFTFTRKGRGQMETSAAWRRSPLSMSTERVSKVYPGG